MNLMKRRSRDIIRQTIPYRYVTVCTTNAGVSSFRNATALDIVAGQGITVTLPNGIVGFSWHNIEWWQVSENGEELV